jgi:hypothetical protein
MSQCGGELRHIREAMLFAVVRRNSLRNKSFKSKIALDAVLRTSHSIALVCRRRCRCSYWGDCSNVRSFGRAEFA